MTKPTFPKTCPDIACARPMVIGETCARCPRCGFLCLFPSDTMQRLMNAHMKTFALVAAEEPQMVEAYNGWLSNEAYWDGRGYRLKSDARRRATWSKVAVKFFPNCDDFHEAAHAWKESPVRGK